MVEYFSTQSSGKILPTLSRNLKQKSDLTNKKDPTDPFIVNVSLSIKANQI